MGWDLFKKHWIYGVLFGAVAIAFTIKIVKKKDFDSTPNSQWSGSGVCVPRWHLKPNEQYVYEVRKTAQVSLSKQQDFQTDILGTIQLQAYRSDQSTYSVYGEFVPQTIVPTEYSSFFEQARKLNLLAFTFQLKPSGEISDLSFLKMPFDAAISSALYAQLQDIVQNLSVPLPEFKEGSTQVKIKREGAYNPYEGLAQLINSENGLCAYRYQKQSQRFSKIPVLNIVASNHQVVFKDRQGAQILEMASGDEKLSFSQNDAVKKLDFKLSATGSYTLKWIETKKRDWSDQVLVRFNQGSTAYKPVAQTRLEKLQRVQPMLSKDEALRRVSQVAVGGKSQERNHVFQSLISHLARDATLRPMYVKRAIQSASDRGFEFHTFIGALGVVGTPECQKGLVEVFTAADSFGRRAVIDQFTLLQEQRSEETVKFLKSLYQGKGAQDSFEKTQAGLALGAALKFQDLPDVQAYFENRFKKGTEGEKSDLLTMMGNSGNAAFIDEITAATKSKIPEVRSNAVWALRSINRPESTNLIAELLRSERDADVRDTAYSSVAQKPWSSDIEQFYLQCVSSEVSLNRKKACAERIIQNKRQAKTGVRFLQLMARDQNTPTQLRDLIKKELKDET